MTEPRPQLALLFACNLNRVRSPMAEGIMRRAGASAIIAASCGIRRDPAEGEGGGLDPFLCAVMREVDIDLGAHQSKSFDDLKDRSFDLVISLTSEAHDCAVELAGARGFTAEYWPTTDPTLASGSRETILDVYRQVRDDLERRIQRRFQLTNAAD